MLGQPAWHKLKLGYGYTGESNSGTLSMVLMCMLGVKKTTALSLVNQKKAFELQRAVTDTSSDLLPGTARLVRQGITEIARESERGIVELSTVQDVNSRLVATIHETLQI